MNEEKLIAALNKILSNIETGPLSDFDALFAEVQDDSQLLVESAGLPFGLTIDTPQLVREFVAALHEMIAEKLGEKLVKRFWENQATRPEEFAELAVEAIEHMMIGGAK